MESDVSFQSENFDSDNISVEDCQYILRAMEKRAFEHVVCALRAQGPLSEYKEVILDHLKSLFFISDDEFLLRLRICANDPILTQIAEKLNPSYDISSEWLAAGASLTPLDFPKMVQLNTKQQDQLAREWADEMRRQMSAHNARLDDERQALLKLLRLTKKPYVPEKLRRLLLDSENDVHGRVDVIREKSTAKSTTGQRGRPPRRFENKRITPERVSKRSVRETARRDAAVPVTTRKTSPRTMAAKAHSVNAFEPLAMAGKAALQKSPSNTATFLNASKAKQQVHVERVENASGSSVFIQSPAQKTLTPSMTSDMTSSILPATTSSANTESMMYSSTMSTNGAAVAGLQYSCSQQAAQYLPQSQPQQQQQQHQATKATMKIEEIENYKSIDEFSIHYSGGANVVVVDPEDQSSIKEPKVRKRRAKLVDDVTCTCARVMPFIFEEAVGDAPKPPRGNPDKRCSKTKASKRTQSSNNNDLNYPYITAQQPQPIQQQQIINYTPKSVSYYNSAAVAGDIHSIKRSRTTSISDDSNILYSKTSHHPRVLGSPLNILGGSQRSSAVYYGGGAAPSAASLSQPSTTTMMLMDTAHSSMSSSSFASSSSSTVVYVTLPPPQSQSQLAASSSSSTYLLAPADPNAITISNSFSPNMSANTNNGDHCYYAISAPTRSSIASTSYTSVPDATGFVMGASAIEPVIVTGMAPASSSGGFVVQYDPINGGVSNSSSGFTSSYITYSETTRPALNSQPPRTTYRRYGYRDALDASSSSSNAEPFVSTKSNSVIAGAVPPRSSASISSSSSRVGSVKPPKPGSESIIGLSTNTRGCPMTTLSTNGSKEGGGGDGAGTSSSGLDFLASTASLFVPMGKQQMLMNQSTTADAQSSSQFCQQQQHQAPLQPQTFCYMTAPASSTCESAAPIFAVATDSPTSSTAVASQVVIGVDNDMAQNFLKQHASTLVDTNGVPLSEELTLGSIIRSSNLRNKLFSAAGKTSSPASPSPNANTPADR